MSDTVRLLKGFKAGTKNDPRDVAAIADALRVTGHLPRPAGVAALPSEAAVGGALRSFQDREGLVVDGLARPGGQTERHLAQMADREKGKRFRVHICRPQRNRRQKATIPPVVGAVGCQEKLMV